MVEVGQQDETVDDDGNDDREEEVMIGHLTVGQNGVNLLGIYYIGQQLVLVRLGNRKVGSNRLAVSKGIF